MRGMKKIITGYLISSSICFSSLAYAENNALDCIIEPSISAELSTSVPGVLQKINVEKGEFVKKGDLLARLNSDVELNNIEMVKIKSKFRAQLNSKKSNYSLAVNNLRRIDGLYVKKLISKHEQEATKVAAEIAKFELDSVYENIKLAKAELKRAYSILELRSIYSPLTGFVIEKYKTAGEYVDEEPVLKVMQIDPLYVELIAPVSLFGDVKKGAVVEVFLEQPIGGMYEALVIVVDPIIDAGSDTFGIRLELPNPGNKIPVGLSCHIKIKGIANESAPK